MIEAVVFDMDGVIVDSEPIWQEVRVDLVGEYGHVWTDADGDACRGRESESWAAAISGRIERALTPDEVFVEVLRRMLAAYDRALPLFPGAIEAVERVAGKYKVAVASGSPNALIDLVLAKSGLDRVCAAVGYGDEMANGKPEPDVYLSVLSELRVSPTNAVGVEDSVSGLMSVLGAGMRAIAIVSPEYELPSDLVARTEFQLSRLGDLTLPRLETVT